MTAVNPSAAILLVIKWHVPNGTFNGISLPLLLGHRFGHRGRLSASDCVSCFNLRIRKYLRT